MWSEGKYGQNIVQKNIIFSDEDTLLLEIAGLEMCVTERMLV